MAISEQQLQRTIVEGMRAALPRGWLVAHVANKPRSRVSGAIEKAMGAVKGFPDLIILGEGEVYFMEVKVEGGYLSPDQKAVRDRLLGLKHRIGVVRSFDDVCDLARTWGWPWSVAA